ncbi:MAG: LamG-like jellyroll fold domain-containing protein, partial [Myxococcota bacterium]
GRCGDGIVQVGIETCDDGNTSANDYCAADCRSVTGRCGDGIVQSALEACDDGNTGANDYCAADCKSITGRCGDGLVQSALEACDDGNTAANDYCAADCTTVTGNCSALAPGEPSLVLGCRDDVPELALCLTFAEDDTGTCYDGSPSQREGTIYGLDQTLAETGGRRARRFDGTTYIDFGDGAPLDDFTSLTVEGWLFLESYPAPLTRYTILDDHLEFGLFIRSDGSVRCAFAASSSGADFYAGQVPLNEWVHVACRVTPSAMSIFVAGQEIGTLPGAIQGRAGEPEPLLIGANSPQADDRLVGYMVDVRVWRGARSDGALCQSALR